MPAERVRAPEQLYVPPDFSQDHIDRITSGLTPEDGREFARQVMQAVKDAQEQGDLRPINLVIESWYRTLLFITRPAFPGRWSSAGEEEVPLSLDEIRERRARRTG